MNVYIYRVLISLDQVANAVLGGKPDETVSYRAAVAQKKGKRWGCVLCAFLDYVDPDHCENSLRSKLFRVAQWLRVYQ